MSQRPTTIGGTINVDDSAALALLDPAGLPIGTQVWNADVGAYFKLTTSDRTVITAETTDGYDDPTWSFANATFTGKEGCTLVVICQDPNAAFSRAYVIDTVTDTTDVTVLSPPAGATSGEFFGSVVLYDDALAADSVVAVSGVIGARWVAVASGTVSTNATLTGDGSSGSPLGVITTALSVSTPTAAGIQSANGRSEQSAFGAALTDATATVQPGSGHVGAYVLPAATLTNNRITTLGITGSTNGDLLTVVCRDLTTHEMLFKSNAGVSLFSWVGNTVGHAKALFFLMSSGDWIFADMKWVD